VLDITMWTGPEALAAAAVVFAAAGSDAQRTWVYERLLPYAGSHVVVGGCASYHAAVDHHLGALAASLGDTAAADVHVLTLVGHHLARMGADPVLDQRAKRSYQERLACLAEDIEDAETAGRAGRAEVLRNERDALIRELAAAAGLGHRDRKLGDEAERARKTVSARVRDALSKIGPVHPELAVHLRGSLRLGTRCSYSPPVGVTWKVN
jgi:hypothetical protein